MGCNKLGQIKFIALILFKACLNLLIFNNSYHLDNINNSRLFLNMEIINHFINKKELIYHLFSNKGIILILISHRDNNIPPLNNFNLSINYRINILYNKDIINIEIIC